MENEREIRYFSMFSGVGGFELGLTNNPKSKIQEPETQQDSSNTCRNDVQRTTFSCVGVSEIDKYASELLSQKFPTVKNWGDCTKINPSELPDFDMLCGGFPCQSFSIAGKRKGFDDTRGTMFFEIARILEVKRPKLVLLENVKGLLNHEKGKTFSVIIQTLEELGYEVQWMVLNSKFFGVPQNRERVFIIGSLRGERRPEILPFGEECQEINELQGQQTNTLKARYQAIGDGSYIIKSKLDAQIKIRTNTQKGYDEAGKNDGIRLQFPESTTARGRVVKGASQTLQAGATPGVLDNMKIRKLTPTECERLQGFPDGWTEGFSDTQRYKMMGNAVTVNVIRAIAQSLNLPNTHKINKESVE